jgi:hypothetical protein
MMARKQVSNEGTLAQRRAVTLKYKCAVRPSTATVTAIVVAIATLSISIQVCAFTPQQQHYRRSPFVLQAVGGDDEPEPNLVLTDIERQMALLRSKYPTGESDYLAAARARSQAKMASTERQATDDDWKSIAAAKKETGAVSDGWEESLVDAGNAESQVLIPMSDIVVEDGGDSDEPKLLLF